MFGQKPQIFLLGTTVYHSRLTGWLSTKQNSLQHMHMQQNWPQTAEPSPNLTEMLPSGTLVLKRSHPPGRNKIQHSWGETIYEIMVFLDDKGRVYSLNQPDLEKNVNCCELKLYPCAHPALPETPLPESPSPSPESQGTSMLEEESEMGGQIMVNWPLPRYQRGSETNGITVAEQATAPELVPAPEPHAPGPIQKCTIL